MKVLSVLGSVPEARSLAPILEDLKRVEGTKLTLCITAMGREIRDLLLKGSTFDIDYDLDLVSSPNPSVDLLNLAVEPVRQVVKGLEPDWIVVQGDTSTALAASLAAFFEGRRVAHVESHPYKPASTLHREDQINRHMVRVLSSRHYVPSRKVKEELLKDNFRADEIVILGAAERAEISADRQMPPEEMGRDLKKRMIS